jgi:hypothetical protein
MKNKRIWQIVGEVVVAAITALITALTTTSCTGFGPF